MQQHQVTVREAVAEDAPAIVDTLTEAFRDDPLMSWFIPDAARRPE